MIVTWRIGLRIALIVVVTIVLQISFFSYLSLFGTTPNVVPLMVVSLGLLGGGMIGAVCGFAAGLLLDSALLQTLGVSSLVLLGAGYLAGRYREGAEVSNSLIPPLLAGVLTTAAAAGFAAIQLMLGVHDAGQPPGPERDPRPGPAGRAADDPDLSADPQGPAPGDRRRPRRARGEEPDHPRGCRGRAGREGAASGAPRGVS